MTELRPQDKLTIAKIADWMDTALRVTEVRALLLTCVFDHRHIDTFGNHITNWVEYYQSYVLQLIDRIANNAQFETHGKWSPYNFRYINSPDGERAELVFHWFVCAANCKDIHKALSKEEQSSSNFDFSWTDGGTNVTVQVKKGELTSDGTCLRISQSVYQPKKNNPTGYAFVDINTGTLLTITGSDLYELLQSGTVPRVGWYYFIPIDMVKLLMCEYNFPAYLLTLESPDVTEKSIF